LSQRTFCNCIRDTYGHKIKTCARNAKTTGPSSEYLVPENHKYTPYYEDEHVRNDYQAMRRNNPEDRRPQIGLLGLSALYTRRFKDQLKITLFPYTILQVLTAGFYSKVIPTTTFHSLHNKIMYLQQQH